MGTARIWYSKVSSAWAVNEKDKLILKNQMSFPSSERKTKIAHTRILV
jgi:hypothetical protein